MILLIDEEPILKEMFSGWVSDTHPIDWADEDRKSQIRCAITAYSHHVQYLLADVYGLDQEEGE